MEKGRKEKIEQAVKQFAAEVIERESNRDALITVSNVTLLDRGRNAMIYVTILPETMEESALNFLKRKRKDIRDVLMKKLGIHPIPFLDVAIDKGEKARQTIETLLRE